MELLNSTVLTPNITTSPEPPPAVSTDNLVPVVVLCVCFCLGLPGNISVIIFKPNWQHLSSLSQILMLNLAVSDMLCLLTLPLWIYYLLYSWIFGLVACKILGYLVYCCLYSSLLTVTTLSVQRYLQVVYVQKFLKQGGAKRLLVVLWLVAMLLSIHALVIREPIKGHHKTFCEPNYSSKAQMVAVLLSESLMGFISFSILVFAYICLHRKVNQAAFFSHPKTTRLVTSIIVTFFVLWMPHLIINVLGVAAISLNNAGLLKFCMDSWDIVGALIFVNSCLNPLLYAFASRNMCTACQNTEHKCWC
ncbi:C3a anaphylatoxin chemotactic receptor-like [Echeneis naucrates]|uniref:C3a anaphylatoxin chemotactic receptor-like n=1 Tax=Echeneis naucrates TaxID=173247 RepID=UPI00111363FC|nr:C3a anaphylatoxin chemotactic receptor-like [Echeneis naucrates]